MTLTASALGQDPRFLAIVSRAVQESLEDRAVRVAAAELRHGSALAALSVLEAHARKESQ